MAEPTGALERHDRVLLAPGWRAQLLAPLAPGDLAALLAWDPARRTLVLARPLPGDGPGTVRLGLALPGRRRVGLAVARVAIARREPPPALEVVLPAAPPAWRPGLAALAARLRAVEAPAGVYGSLAWEAAAGGPGAGYLTPASDVDLLLRPGTWAALEAALAVLAGHAAGAPSPRLDGELVLPGGAAVAWRELGSGAARVLARGPAGPVLVARETLRGALEGGVA